MFKKIITMAAAIAVLTPTYAEEVKLGGSTTFKAVFFTSKKLDSIKEILKKDDISLKVSATSSGSGLKDLTKGKVNLSMSSGGESTYGKVEGIDKSEYPMLEVAIGRFVIIVNKKNEKVKSLTAKQVKDIYTGTIKNWNEVGGEDEEITVVAESKTGGVRSHVFKGVTFGKKVTELLNGGKMLRAISANPKAIGYGVVVSDSSRKKLEEKVKVIDVEGEGLRTKVTFALFSKKDSSESVKKAIEAIKKSVN